MEKATQREHSGLGIMMKETIIMKPAAKRHQYYIYLESFRGKVKIQVSRKKGAF